MFTDIIWLKNNYASKFRQTDQKFQKKDSRTGRDFHELY